MRRYFHSTTQKLADEILHLGFRNHTGRYGTDKVWTGVWISDRPLDGNEGVPLQMVVLAVDIDEESIHPYEWVEEGKSYREFLVPAAILNRGKITEIDDSVGDISLDSQSWRKLP